MIKELIDLQRNSNATCAIIENKDIRKLYPGVAIKANVSDKFLFAHSKPPFADIIDEKSKNSEKCYLVIKGIDEISIDQQNRYNGLVKDRELNRYFLPDNCVIVFTVENRNGLKKVSKELYHFAVVAF